MGVEGGGCKAGGGFRVEAARLGHGLRVGAERLGWGLRVGAAPLPLAHTVLQTSRRLSAPSTRLPPTTNKRAHALPRFTPHLHTPPRSTPHSPRSAPHSSSLHSLAPLKVGLRHDVHLWEADSREERPGGGEYGRSLGSLGPDERWFAEALEAWQEVALGDLTVRLYTVMYTWCNSVQVMYSEYMYCLLIACVTGGCPSRHAKSDVCHKAVQIAEHEHSIVPFTHPQGSGFSY